MTTMDGPLVLPDPVVKGAGLYAGIGDYVKVEPKRYAPKTLRETAEGRYWRAYKAPALINAVSQVTSLHFHFPWVVKSLLRWSVFCAATRRKPTINLNWRPYFKIADDESLSLDEKLVR